MFVSGLAILVVHPRLYWGEVGALGGPSMFDLPIPERVANEFGGRLATVAALSRGVGDRRDRRRICVRGVITGHFRRHLLPARTQRPSPYSMRQRLAYLSIVFGLFPVIVWTGLAMSPALTSAFPFLVTLVGGQQSARTIHFAASGGLLLFVAGHVVMAGGAASGDASAR